MHEAPPAGWPQAQSSLYYRDAAKAIEWLCDAFGFELRLKVEGEPGQIIHSELTYGEGVIMVSQELREAQDRQWKLKMRSPKSLDGACTQTMMLYVDDANAHCEHARSRGAVIIDEPSTHDYGEGYWADRSYGATDIEGHMWWITQRLRNPGQK
jgi:uncharacterized glyoxalase superfamily protein PhnB